MTFPLAPRSCRPGQSARKHRGRQQECQGTFVVAWLTLRIGCWVVRGSPASSQSMLLILVMGKSPRRLTELFIEILVHVLRVDFVGPCSLMRKLIASSNSIGSSMQTLAVMGRV